MRISPRTKEYLTVGRTLEELRQQEPEMRAVGFRKRRNGQGQATTVTKEFFQWWDRVGSRSNWTETQQERKSKGLCVKCGQPAALKRNAKTSQFCLKHLTQHRERQRARLGFKRRYTGSTSYQTESAYTTASDSPTL